MAHRVADRFEPVITRGFIAAVNDVRSRIDIDSLASEIAANAPLDSIVAEVPIAPIATMQEGFPNVPPTFFPLLEEAIATAAIATGRGSAEIITDIADVDFAFSATDPNVIMFARERGAALVRLVSDDVRAVIREVIALGADQGLTPMQQARLIRHVVGLTPNWASAPLNFAEELRAGQTAAATSRLMGDPLLGSLLRARDAGQMTGEIAARIETGTVTEEWIERMQTRYSRNLLHRRALTIARTESITAANHGLRTSWRQAAREGVLPPQARRFAIVTPDERLRETHAAVPGMNPDGVALDEPFSTPFGPQPGPPWPADPINCRCSEGLQFPGLRGLL